MMDRKTPFRSPQTVGTLLAAFLWICPGVGLARSEEHFDFNAYINPEKMLQKSEVPWLLAERYLEAGEFQPVLNYLESLRLPKQQIIHSKIESLVKAYAGDYSGALDRLTSLPPSDSGGQAQRAYLSRLVEITTGFEEILSTSTRFRFQADKDHLFLLLYAIPALEEAWTGMGDRFGLTPSTTVIVEIYPTRESFSAASTLSSETLDRSGAIGICKFRRIMIVSPQSLPLGYRWLDALSHEFNHYLISQVSGSLCPLWLHEGIARYYETAWRRDGSYEPPPSSQNLLAKAVETDSLIPFQRMEPSMVYLKDQEEVSLAFAQVSDAVGYMLDRYGEKTLVSLLRSFKTRSREESFVSVLGISEQDLEAEWKRSLSDKKIEVSTGAIIPKVYFQNIDEVDSFVGADSRGHIRLGDRLKQKGQTAVAAVQYQKAVDLEPNNGVALGRAARMLIAQDNIAKAEEYLRTAVEKNPSYVTVYIMLGELLYDDGRYYEARDVLYEAAGINPFHPKIHEILGLIHLDFGNYDMAKSEVQLALRLDPRNTALRDVLANMPKH
ncbi:MAG TPA: peptidase MA family metallohydrolase [Elusimicrobiota bacterium]|nr:peptidase MA family metallohydrolase [Elusimicrobiota bacterium]